MLIFQSRKAVLWLNESRKPEVGSRKLEVNKKRAT